MKLILLATGTITLLTGYFFDALSITELADTMSPDGNATFVTLEFASRARKEIFVFGFLFFFLGVFWNKVISSILFIKENYLVDFEETEVRNRKKIKGVFGRYESVSILLIYLLLTLFMTYPVVFNMFNAIPGPPDDNQPSLWNFWWFKTSLIDLQTTPFFTKYLYYPEGINTAFHESSIFNSLLSIPLQFFFNLFFTYNLIFFSSFVLSAYGMFLLARYLTKNSRAAFIAGLIFTFSPYHIGYSLYIVPTASIQFIPFFILFFLKTFDNPNRKDAILAGIFMAITSLCSWYHMLSLMIFITIFVAYRVITKNWTYPFLKSLLLIAFVFTVITSPFIYPMFKEYLSSEVKYASMTSGYNKHVTDSLTFIVPGSLHPLYLRTAKLIEATFSGTYKLRSFFLGYLVIILSVYSIRRLQFKDKRLWIYITLTFMILSMGPSLHILGRYKFPGFSWLHLGDILNYSGVPISPTLTDTLNRYLIIPLPYAVFKYIPFINVSRVSNRFMVMVYLGVAVLAAYAIAKILEKSRSKRIFEYFRLNSIIFYVFSFIVLFEFLAVPLPMSNLKIPEEYTPIMNDKEEFGIVEVPMGGRNPNIHYMFLQTIHKRKITSGAISRIPPDAYKFIKENQVLNMLNKYEKIDKEMKISQDSIAELKDNEIKYIVLHLNFLKKEDYQKIASFLNNFFKLIESTERIMIYRVY